MPIAGNDCAGVIAARRAFHVLMVHTAPALVGFALFFVQTAAADAPKSLRCDFTQMAARDNGRLKIGREELSVVYDSIDPIKQHARMIANAGATDVAVILTGEGIHFLEVTNSGRAISPVTLRKHFRESLNVVAAKMKAKVAINLLRLSERNATAAIFLAKTRLGLRETVHHKISGGLTLEQLLTESVGGGRSVKRS
jgi:hypothetical protein